MSKPEIEFTAADSVGWTPVPGAASGLSERVLARDGDGDGDLPVTRILRFEPGTDTSPNGVLTHEYWEEVYILEGDMTDLRLGQTFTAGMYAVRPPGMEHGPWTSESGCLTYEVRYWEGQRP
jgi:hypothetical protein